MSESQDVRASHLFTQLLDIAGCNMYCDVSDTIRIAIFMQLIAQGIYEI